MAKDRAVGAALVVGAVVGVIIYGFLMFYNGPVAVALYTLEITAFVAVRGYSWRYSDGLDM